MRVGVFFDMGIEPDETEYTVEFMWDIGDVPLPRRGDRVTLGELILSVGRAQYVCSDTEYIASRDYPVRPVEVELQLKLSKHTRRCRRTPQEFHTILSALPSVTDLHVTGAEQ
ncbi:MAG: hypothetical protein JO362_19435 [Streptomycetaceae bacterium]|nr:hypothetical protein [Streptomycetaceae bacterium]